MRDFRKYEVWKLAHDFVINIYKTSGHFPKTEMYGLTSQIRRAASSIPINFSEGCGRNTDTEFVRFIHIALGSAHEVEYILQLCYDLKYLNEDNYSELNTKVNLIKRMLFSLEQKIKA